MIEQYNNTVEERFFIRCQF